MHDLARADTVVALSPVEQVLLRMQTARQQLAEARTIGEVKQVADGAAAICAWLRRQADLGLEIHNDGQLLKLQAEARMGEFLKRPDAVKGDGRPKKPSENPTVSAPTHKDLGISRWRAQELREVALVSRESLEELACEATAKGKDLTREQVLKVARRLKAQAETAATAETPDEPAPIPEHAASAALPAEFLNTVVTGDARELARLLPDNSVALCLCDPVYERIEDYEWLARECKRVLIPGGNLIAQCGNLRRFYAEDAMRRSGLTYVDLLAEVYPYALCPVFPLRLQIGWKPYLWFSKGPRVGEWMMNRVHAKGKRSADDSKDLHAWGDAEDFARGVIERLCTAGEVVWDPFSGSGTVPVVAKRLGLPCVAFEINPESAQAARSRLHGTRRTTPPQGHLWEDEETIQ